MVVLGRPKGDRGSYQQWQEANIPPQVVFEILSPGNTVKEMIKKYKFYERYGVEEYYLYDPDRGELTGWLRSSNELQKIDEMAGWVSPQLKIRFELAEGELEIYQPDGQKFVTYVELAQQKQQAQQRAEEAESQLQALGTLLQERGINPDNL